MENPISWLFRRRALKKYASMTRTGMIPLSSIHKVFILLDGSDPEAGACASSANGFFRGKGIRPDIFYIDTRSRKKQLQGPVSDPTSTLQKKDLNWYGRPRKKVLQTFLETEQDLFIDLTGRCDFPVRFIGTAIPARFKVGCTQAQDGKPVFDMTVTPQASSGFSSTELFRGISSMLLAVE